MTAINIREPTDRRLRRAMQDRALPAFESAAELQAWLDEIDVTPTNLAEVRASLTVIKDKLSVLAISVALANRP